MDNRSAFEKVRNCLNKGQRFVITTHVNPDGDGLGSEAAIAAYLTEMGKDVYIFNSSEVPPNYDFLNPDKRMVVYQSERHRETILTADYFIIVDISDWHRLRSLGVDIKDTDIPKVCIDHHPPQGKFGDVRLINTDASSTGEIVFELLTFCGAKITKSMGEALYTCILTDTGSFRFSNTTARCLQIAANLVECGVETHRLYQRIYERQSRAKTKLLGYVIEHLNFEEKGRIAWITLPKGLVASMGAKPSDTEGFADYPRVINGVEMTAMFHEMEGERVKISLRSKGNIPINGVAQKFGGGGHPFASGILMEGKLQDHVNSVLKELAKVLNSKS